MKSKTVQIILLVAQIILLVIQIGCIKRHLDRKRDIERDMLSALKTVEHLDSRGRK